MSNLKKSFENLTDNASKLIFSAMAELGVNVFDLGQLDPESKEFKLAVGYIQLLNQAMEFSKAWIDEVDRQGETIDKLNKKIDLLLEGQLETVRGISKMVDVITIDSDSDAGEVKASPKSRKKTAPEDV